MIRNLIKKFDDRVANLEAGLVTLLLLLMIVVASLQALLRNMTDWGIEAANVWLASLDWADPFLQKGTLFLAFLGASLATYHEKHIGIDVLQKIAPPRIRQLIKAFVSLIASVTCFVLGRIFFLAVANIAKDIPMDFVIIESGQSIHICDAAASTLANEELGAPTVFCGIRSFLSLFQIPVSTPESIFQSFVPLMFIVLGLRFLGKFAGSLEDFKTASSSSEPDLTSTKEA